MTEEEKYISNLKKNVAIHQKYRTLNIVIFGLLILAATGMLVWGVTVIKEIEDACSVDQIINLFESTNPPKELAYVFVRFSKLALKYADLVSGAKLMAIFWGCSVGALFIYVTRTHEKKNQIIISMWERTRVLEQKIDELERAVGDQKSQQER